VDGLPPAQALETNFRKVRILGTFPWYVTTTASRCVRPRIDSGLRTGQLLHPGCGHHYDPAETHRPEGHILSVVRLPPMIGQCKPVIGIEYVADSANGTQSMKVFWESDPILLGGPPRSARRFARQVDDLVKAANRWSRKEYLRALEAYALSLAPPASATAETDGFGVTMAFTDIPSSIHASGLGPRVG